MQLPLKTRASTITSWACWELVHVVLGDKVIAKAGINETNLTLHIHDGKTDTGSKSTVNELVAMSTVFWKIMTRARKILKWRSEYIYKQDDNSSKYITKVLVSWNYTATRSEIWAFSPIINGFFAPAILVLKLKEPYKGRLH